MSRNSGRGHWNRGRGGRGGRGHFRKTGGQANASKTKFPERKEAKDYVFEMGARSSADFETVIEYWINKIAQDTDKGSTEITEALEKREHVDWTQPELELLYVRRTDKQWMDRL